MVGQRHKAPFYYCIMIVLCQALIIAPIIVSAQPSNSVTRIDAKVAPIQAYFWTPGIEINPSADKIYIVNQKDTDELVIYNASDCTLTGTIPEKYYPLAIAINPKTDKVYVSHYCNCNQGKSITVIDGKSDSVIKTIEGVMHGNLFVDTLGNRIYSINGTAVSIIDGTSDDIFQIQRIEGNKDQPIGIMTFNPLTHKAYGIDQNKAIVSLDLDTYALTTTNVSLTPARYPSATGNTVKDMVVSPISNLLYIIEEPTYECPESCSPVGRLVTVNASSGNFVDTVQKEVGGFWKDLTIDPKTNVVYVMNGPGFVAINATSNILIGNYYIPELTEYYPRAILVNSVTGSISILAPNGAVTIPALENVPEFGSYALLSTAAGFLVVIIVLRSHAIRNPLIR